MENCYKCGAAPMVAITRRSEESIPPSERGKPEIRKRMSGPALNTFFNIADNVWKLDPKVQAALLGRPGTSTFYNYKKGRHGALPYDVLTRISLVFGIFKDLRILYPERSLADRWVNMPNSNPLFGGNTPANFMASGDIDALYRVRRFLD